MLNVVGLLELSCTARRCPERFIHCVWGVFVYRLCHLHTVRDNADVLDAFTVGDFKTLITCTYCAASYVQLVMLSVYYSCRKCLILHCVCGIICWSAIQKMPEKKRSNTFERVMLRWPLLGILCYWSPNFHNFMISLDFLSSLSKSAKWVREWPLVFGCVFCCCIYGCCVAGSEIWLDYFN